MRGWIVVSPDPPEVCRALEMMWEFLTAVALRGAEPAAVDWLRGNLAKDDVAGTTARFRAVFAGAGRRLGGSVLKLTPDEMTQLYQSGLVAPERWHNDQCARAALLLRGLETLSFERHTQLLREVYLRGDCREQAAVLQALMLLPDPGRFTAIAVDACRTNVRDVFEAIACENRYPAAYFPEENFNQLVLKAFFIGVAVARISRLEQRKTAELRRMAQDYASERRAAGRPVPADLDLVLRVDSR
jgi:hypothetical protein